MSFTADRLLKQDFNKIQLLCATVAKEKISLVISSHNDEVIVPLSVKPIAFAYYEFIDLTLATPNNYLSWCLNVLGGPNSKFDGFKYILNLKFSKRYPCMKIY